MRKFDKTYDVECLINGKWIKQLCQEKMSIKKIKRFIEESGYYDNTFDRKLPKARLKRRIKI